MQPIVHEVGPRDGLQIEKKTVPTSKKIEWIDGLIAAGVDVVQLGSFVNPAKVPQMADTEQIFLHYRANKPASARLSALVLNDKGLDRGFACGVEFFCMGVSASETHSRKNTGAGTRENLARILAMARRAEDVGAAVQLSVQSAFGCSYEGTVPSARVLDIVEAYLHAGFRNISLADTAGHATPDRVEAMFNSLLDREPDIECACHFHDTYGLALANCYAAWRVGVRSFESAFGGLGGCPFAALSSGNVATEDLVHLFRRIGIRDDIDLEKLIGVAKDAETFFERTLPGVIHRIGTIPHGETVTV